MQYKSIFLLNDFQDLKFNIFTFQVITDFQSYAIPADVWSLGVLILFRCKGTHQFLDHSEVLTWKKTNELQEQPFHDDLKNLVTSMLDPETKARPSAEKIFNETLKKNRVAFQI